MAIREIIRMGHPCLARIADPVADPTAAEIGRLAADMAETMEDSSGAGLAAPQVGVSLRVVVFHVPAGRAAGEAVPLTVLVNPVIEPLDEEQTLSYEACLSLPGLTGEVPRFRRVRYRGVGLDGAVIERVAEGFHARVVQHECDHLDGILYPMRMRGLETFGFVDEVRARILGRLDEE
jgi:peptide deformylase